MSRTCDRAEVLAGAIALGEATDADRYEYRAHLSACDRCLTELSGERDLERLAGVVASARDAESWEPVLPAPWVTQRVRRAKLLRYSSAVAGIALAIGIGAHFVVAGSVKTLHATPANPITLAYDGTRVTLDRHARSVQHTNISAVPPAAVATSPQPARIVVEHNEVTLKAQQSQSLSGSQIPQNVERSATQTVAVVTTPRPRAVPAAAHVLPSVHVDNATTQVALAQTPQPMENHAESLAVMQPNTIHNAAPLGGASSINPQPPMIAYAQGAEGTTAFEVIIDTQGAPVKCTITKSSGFLSLDDAVCHAAMQAKYSPKQVNGHAVQGIYHDAFTFHTEPQ